MGPAPDVRRRLYLLRHAKSSWDEPGLPDALRPLTPRGRQAAHRMALHLRDEGVHPDLVLCSSARRARQTLSALSPEFGKSTKVKVEEELYGAGARALLARIRLVPPGVRSVMVIGHNPGVQDLAVELAREDDGGDGDALAGMRTKFPTAAMATLIVEGTGWEDVGPGRGRLVSFVVPRRLPAN